MSFILFYSFKDLESVPVIVMQSSVKEPVPAHPVIAEPSVKSSPLPKIR